MNLTNQDLRIQEAILTKIHGCSIEEARERELTFGSYVNIYDKVIEQIGCVREGELNGEEAILIDTQTRETVLRNQYSIIGLPPTLSRVLSALGGEEYWYGIGRIMPFSYGMDEYLCKRKLLDDNGRELSLFDQSQETKDIIEKILIPTTDTND